MAIQAACLLFVWCVFITNAEAQCSSTTSHKKEVDGECVELFLKLQTALLVEKENRFVLPEIFYPESRVQPILIKVNYTVHFLDNNETNCTVENGTSFTFGWSQRSVYTYFHVAVINQLRHQLPFWVMGFLSPLLSTEPSLDALMWTGTKSQNLSFLLLNLKLDKCYQQENISQALYSVTEYVSLKLLYMSYAHEIIGART